MSKKLVVTRRETHDHDWGIYEHFWFDSGEWVCINKTTHGWEYDQECVKDLDEDFYLEGSFTVEDGSVIDYDGCYELPQAVISALRRCGYKVEL